VGLLFTDEEPKVVIEYFESYHPADYARAGNEAKETITLPEGEMERQGPFGDAVKRRPHTIIRPMGSRTHHAGRRRGCPAFHGAATA
jgi:hypothetical protein